MFLTKQKNTFIHHLDFSFSLLPLLMSDSLRFLSSNTPLMSLSATCLTCLVVPEVIVLVGAAANNWSRQQLAPQLTEP